MPIVEAADPCRPVEGRLRYLAPGEQHPVYYASVGGEGARLDMHGLFEQVAVAVHDARRHAGGGERFSLDVHGFERHTAPSAVDDFYDPGELPRVYEPELCRLVARVSGARRVVVFDHTLRADDPGVRAARAVREPSTVVHNDYTERSALQRLRDTLGADAEALAGRRFAVINVWRPIAHPVETSPLALCDARSLAEADCVATERRARDRVGELLLLRANPAHRWFYFPRLHPAEVLLIKTYDAARDGRAKFAPHAAFDVPAAAPGAAPRQSVESRCFAFF